MDVYFIVKGSYYTDRHLMVIPHPSEKKHLVGVHMIRPDPRECGMNPRECIVLYREEKIDRYTVFRPVIVLTKHNKTIKTYRFLNTSHNGRTS